MIYFVRHGETDYNKEGRPQGWLDIPLNKTGEMQAEQARKNLSGVKIDRIYCSPLKRALKTAEIINEKYNLKIQTDDRIKEIFGGSMQGKTKKEIPENELKAYYKTPKNFGGEDVSDFCARVADFMQEIEQINENILIVSHAGVSRAIYKYINNLDGFDFEFKAPKNSEIIVIKDK